MKNTQLMPISEGSRHQVYVPTIHFFADKIINRQFFSYAKLSVEWWMLITKALKEAGLRTGDVVKNGIDDKLIPELAKGMSKAWNEKQRGRRKYKIRDSVNERIIRMTVEEKPPGFFLGVTDRCNMNVTTFPLPRRGNMVDLIVGMLPKGEIPIHALPFRIWAIDGQINHFINLIRHKNIVVVGPRHLRNFGYKTKIKNFNFVEIHTSDASLHVEKTKAQIKRLHNGFLSGHEDVTYFFIGGAAAMWLITELHGELRNANLVDIGRAFDVYYFYDPVRRKSPTWMFGQWLTRGNTAWLLNALEPDKNNIYCVK